jgi:6-phosphogluconolactonase (cycloisomerase 2 family)
VTNESSNSISTYRVSQGTGMLMPDGPPMPVGDAPSSIDILRVEGRSGDIAVVTNRRSNTLSLFFIPRSRPRLISMGAPVAIMNGTSPTAIDIAPNGLAAVTLQSRGGGGKAAQGIGAVAIFRIFPTGGATLLGIAPAGTGPTDVEIVRNVAYVTNENSNNVSVFAVMPSGMPMPLNPVPAGQSPQSVAVTPR